MRSSEYWGECMKYRFDVKGMSCAACSTRVDRAVSKLEGVSDCTVSLLTNSMVVEASCPPENIVKAVTAAGYKAKLSKNNTESNENDEIAKLAVRLIVSIIISLPLVVLALNGRYPWVQMILSLAVMVVNCKFFVNGCKGLINLSPNMDTLVALGAFVSFGYSLIMLLTNMSDGCCYFDSAGMILTFITIGKLLEAVSKGKTTDAIKSLKALAPSKALVEFDGNYTEVPVESVKVGDIFIVNPGESFPVDGEVIGGESNVDESSLSGESVPVFKGNGDRVYTSTINIQNALKCRATDVGEDTFLSKIIEMVTTASSSKAPIARIADKIAAVFVPIVLGISLITLLIWLALGTEFSNAVSFAIGVLVVSCPCALGLATPVAIMVGNGVAARHGILFKNAKSLEFTAKIRTIVLDKTGTITKGDLINGDSLKPDSIKAIERLMNMNKSIFMLTGDKKEIANDIAAKVGISNVVSEVLPGQKEEVISRLLGESEVMMVGDGINDAVALTRATVGVAIASGKDIAIDSADVVLLNNSLMDVVSMIKISESTLRTIKINLAYAFLYNIILIPVAGGALSGMGISMSPMFCALAMSLSSFLVVMNSLAIKLRLRGVV